MPAGRPSLRGEHVLLSRTLELLADERAREEISLGVDLLERSIAAVEHAQVAEEDDDLGCTSTKTSSPPTILTTQRPRRLLHTSTDSPRTGAPYLRAPGEEIP